MVTINFLVTNNFLWPFNLYPQEWSRAKKKALDMMQVPMCMCVNVYVYVYVYVNVHVPYVYNIYIYIYIYI